MKKNISEDARQRVPTKSSGWWKTDLRPRFKRWRKKIMAKLGRMRSGVFEREDLKRVRDPRVKEFYRMLHKRGMTLQNIAFVIGCKSHGQISGTIRGVYGRGKEVRMRIIEANVLTTEELVVLGWLEVKADDEKGVLK